MSAPQPTGQAGGGRVRALAPRLLIGLAVAAGLAIVALANTHLVYTAVTSQPECVAHLEAGEGTPGTGQFRAAKPSC